jgi:phosphomannomutase/phosphoglucomutase
MSIYKDCDIRGVYGDDLDEAIAHGVGRAVGTLRPGALLVVGGDVRVSTPALKAALIEGLRRSPVTVLDIGTVPTPAFYDALTALGADGGVMVTASHNPAPYNGFKISLGATPVTPGDIERIAELVRTKAFADGTGAVREVPSLDGYRERMLALLAAPSPLRLVVDAGNGAAALVAPRLLRELGHEVIELFCEIDGRFPNRSPNPAVAASLTALQRRTVDVGADLGIAFDGDGDRAVFVDATGRIASAEEAMVVLARQLVRGPDDLVVYDLKSSSLVAEEIAALGGRSRMERSGHAFIRTAFLREGAVLAGEVSGHFFFRELGHDDAIFAAARMAEFLGRSGMSLSAQIATMRHPVITPDLRIPWAMEERDALLARIEGAFSDRPIMKIDGVRVEFDDGWLLARKSVTEPLVTLRIEAADHEGIAAIRSALLAAVPELAGRQAFLTD